VPREGKEPIQRSKKTTKDPHQNNQLPLVIRAPNRGHARRTKDKNPHNHKKPQNKPNQYNNYPDPTPLHKINTGNSSIYPHS
jgi:hypothetical protein